MTDEVNEIEVGISDAAVSRVVNNAQVKEEYRGALELQAELAFQDQDFILAFFLSRSLRRDRVFERQFRKVAERFAGWVQESKGTSVSAIGDGELFKFFLDWLKDGGWEIILEIIKSFF